MLQVMGVPTGPREYVIEKGETAFGVGAYVAFWRDRVGFTPFAQRAICSCETATGLVEMMTRHYPGAVCVYMPEDVVALVAAAIRATEG
jgi:hypothetical protein